MKRSHADVSEADTNPKPDRFGVPRVEPETALLEKHEIIVLLALNLQPVDPALSKEELLQSLRAVLAQRKTPAATQTPVSGVGPSTPTVAERRMPLCCICKDDDATHVFGVCGHLGVCIGCRERLFPQGQIRGTFGGPITIWRQSAKCPICRTEHAKIEVKPVFSS